MSYSFIGFQSAYIPTHWNELYWDTACLIVNSGSLEDDTDDETISEDEVDETVSKKTKAVNYAKLSKALCRVRDKGVNVSLVDINNSDLTFRPDVKNNRILFGMKALSGINDEAIAMIKAGRPYGGIQDFMNRCPLKKIQMISLIKSGSFDELEKDLGKELNVHPRVAVMMYYLLKVSDLKKKLTLQNFSTLFKQGLVPESLSTTAAVYYINKEIKKTKVGTSYNIPLDIDEYFRSIGFELAPVDVIDGKLYMPATQWDKKVYQKFMDNARKWLAENQEEILKELNKKIFIENWNKYAKGNISAWEMSSLCFYYHDHELKNINNKKYGFEEFDDLPEKPEIDTFFERKGRKIPLYKITRIAGTVVAKNDVKNIISLLTPNSGVVSVKMSKDQYAKFNKQISERQEDGTKKIIEKGWFSRGVKLSFTGFRREDTFVVKTYARTPYHSAYKIIDVLPNGELVMTHERADGDGQE